MAERPRFFDDLAGVAGGALSALSGLREEMEALVRTRLDDAIRRLDLVKRDELDAAMELAANARAGQESAEMRMEALEARVSVLEAAATHHVGLEPEPPQAAGDHDGTRPATDIPPPLDV